MSGGAFPELSPVTAADVPSYAAAAARFFRQTYGHDAGHAAVMNQHCRETFAPAAIGAEIDNPAVTAWVARRDGAILALAQVLACGEEAEIQRFYVDAAWHGRGLAQAMMGAVAARAEALGLQTLRLGVWTQNDRAIAFYRRQGFLPSGTSTFLLDGVPQSDLLMRRHMAGGADAPALDGSP